MQFLIRYPEIGKEPHPEKSKLRRDIMEMLLASVARPTIETDVGRLFLETESDATAIIARIHGISSFSPCVRCSIDELEDRAVAYAKGCLPEGGSFAVSVKRVGDHSFTSRAKAAELGSAISRALPALSVDLTAPDQTIYLEIRGGTCFIFDAVIPGVDELREGARAAITEQRFVVDAMLGTLAARLRGLGFDAECHHDTADSFLLRRSEEDRRILLTQDKELARQGDINAYFVTSKTLKEQLQEVVARFGLALSEGALFTRCSVCNTSLEPISKEHVKDRVPPRAYASYEEFYHCPACVKVFWKGSHYDQMVKYFLGMTNASPDEPGADPKSIDPR